MSDRPTCFFCNAPLRDFVLSDDKTQQEQHFACGFLIRVSVAPGSPLRRMVAPCPFMLEPAVGSNSPSPYGPQSSAPSAQSGGLMQALVECSCWLDNNLAGKNLTEGRRACPIHRDAFLALEARRLQEAEGLAKQLGAIIHYDRVRPSFREANAERGDTAPDFAMTVATARTCSLCQQPVVSGRCGCGVW